MELFDGDFQDIGVLIANIFHSQVHHLRDGNPDPYTSRWFMMDVSHAPLKVMISPGFNTMANEYVLKYGEIY